MVSTFALAGLVCALPGCEAWPTVAGDNGRVTVEDFVGDEARPGTVGPSSSAGPGVRSTDGGGATASPGDTPGRELSVDAMLGHVNGEAIYAQTILEPIDAQLAAFGREFDGDAFLQRAAPVVAGRLKEVLIDKLILAEAGSGLTDREREGVEGMVAARREEILRYYGQGSLAKARAEFLAAEDLEMDEALAQYREELVVRRYLQQELMPQINVQQRDVERLYHDRYEAGEYNTEDRRVVRLMMTRDAGHAGVIASRLASGEAFAEVAADGGVNVYNAAGGGAFNGGEPVTGDAVFAVDAVNEALLDLGAGEHAGPVEDGGRFFFVLVESYEPGVSVPLRDVQVELERALRLEQWDGLFRKFREDLWARGGYTDPVLMTEKLLDIAIARYDLPG